MKQMLKSIKPGLKSVGKKFLEEEVAEPGENHSSLLGKVKGLKPAKKPGKFNFMNFKKGKV